MAGVATFEGNRGVGTVGYVWWGRYWCKMMVVGWCSWICVCASTSQGALFGMRSRSYTRRKGDLLNTRDFFGAIGQPINDCPAQMGGGG